MKISAMLTPYVFVDYDLETGDTEFKFEWYDCIDPTTALDRDSNEITLTAEQAASLLTAVDKKVAEIVFKLPECHDKFDFEWANKIRPFASLSNSLDDVDGSWW